MKTPAWTAKYSGKILDERGAEVAHVFMFRHLGLVAAAPAMLAALQGMVREYEGYFEDAPEPKELRAARAAIAQASHKPAGDI